MRRLGFIHDMLDVKVLILFVAARSSYPMTSQEIYELCYQDECLSYFDICTAVPEMVKSGHLRSVEDDKYEITEKGREAGPLVEDSIAFTVKQKAENAIAKFNRQISSPRSSAPPDGEACARPARPTRSLWALFLGLSYVPQPQAGLVH